MPTYLYQCEACDAELEIWQSIHSDAIPEHDCGAPLTKIITPPRLYAIGDRGAQTRENDTTEARWSKDMDAYMSMRRQGLQPTKIDGAHEAQTDATSKFELESGLRGVPEHRVAESYDMAREAGVI